MNAPGILTIKSNEFMSLLIKDRALSNIRKLVLLVFAFSAVNLFAQDRMTPAEICMDSGLRGYETSLINYFNINEADGFAYLVKPSFTGEYCLTFCKNTSSLKLKHVTKNNIWYEQKWYENGDCRKKQNKKVPSNEYLLTISDSLANTLYSMFKSIVFTSTHLENRILGLDGTTFQFIIQPGHIAECWSPQKDTNCGQAVILIDKLCDAIKSGDSTKAENLISEVIRVTNIFRQYYPTNFEENRYW